MKIRLNVRGICCLRPGVKGVSDTIEVVSIVDRFLEHARIFHFRNGGDEEVYLSSADWMPRNLDRRIELLFPVSSPENRKKVLDTLDAMFLDNVKARRLQPDGSYKRRRPAKGEDPYRAQIELYRETRRGLERARAAAEVALSRSPRPTETSVDRRQSPSRSSHRRRPAPGWRRAWTSSTAVFFFECHDTLEEVWTGIRGSARDFFQGLIQVSVGFYHHGNGNRGGQRSLPRRPRTSSEVPARSRAARAKDPARLTDLRSRLTRVSRNPRPPGARTLSRRLRGGTSVHPNERGVQTMTKRVSSFLVLMTVAVVSGVVGSPGPGKFEWTTKSAEAKQRLAQVQARIESFQFGTETTEAARKLVAADPEFAMGVYYLSAVTPLPENQKLLDRAVELGKKASDGERRFIDAMVIARANQGANPQDAIAPLEKLAAEYPNERLLQVILGQIYQGTSHPEEARAAFEKADRIGPPSPRVRAFLASDDLIRGDYAKARQTFLDVEKGLPKGAAPFTLRYGLTFAYLYEGKVDAALDSLRTYLAEYKDSGSAEGFPEVFIWNSIARINLENGRLDEAMKAYEKGYESVPGSTIPDDQKQIWLGRLHHGRCRVLARMGKHEEAWAERRRSGR